MTSAHHAPICPVDIISLWCRGCTKYTENRCINCTLIRYRDGASRPGLMLHQMQPGRRLASPPLSLPLSVGNSHGQTTNAFRLRQYQGQDEPPLADLDTSSATSVWLGKAERPGASSDQDDSHIIFPEILKRDASKVEECGICACTSATELRSQGISAVSQVDTAPSQAKNRMSQGHHGKKQIHHIATNTPNLTRPTIHCETSITWERHQFRVNIGRIRKVVYRPHILPSLAPILGHEVTP